MPFLLLNQQCQTIVGQSGACPLLLSILTTIFPGEPGLAGFRAKDDGSGGDNWSHMSCKAPVKLSPSANQHLSFYMPDALPVAQPTLSKHCCLSIANYIAEMTPSHPHLIWWTYPCCFGQICVFIQKKGSIHLPRRIHGWIFPKLVHAVDSMI